MEISKGCNVAGDEPAGSPGEVTGPIWSHFWCPVLRVERRETLDFQHGFWLLKRDEYWDTSSSLNE